MIVNKKCMLEVDYHEEEFEPSTVPFQATSEASVVEVHGYGGKCIECSLKELDSLQWATFTSLLRSRCQLRDISMDAARRTWWPSTCNPG